MRIKQRDRFKMHLNRTLKIPLSKYSRQHLLVAVRTNLLKLRLSYACLKVLWVGEVEEVERLVRGD